LPVLRAYELMIIIDSDVSPADADAVIANVADLVADEGGTIKSTDNWGRRKLAYKINHKTEGTYVVWEITTRTAGLPDTERRLRLADDIVRHKLVRLPDTEAERRGLLAEVEPASAG
jgi:small subunit ribosomal protein S6